MLSLDLDPAYLSIFILSHSCPHQGDLSDFFRFFQWASSFLICELHSCSSFCPTSSSLYIHLPFLSQLRCHMKSYLTPCIRNVILIFVAPHSSFSCYVIILINNLLINSLLSFLSHFLINSKAEVLSYL